MLRIHFSWLMHDAPFAVFGTKSVDLPTQSLGSLLNPVWPDDQTIRQLLSRLSNLWDLCAAYQICGAWTFFSPFRWQQERQWGKDTLKFYNADFLDALTRVLQKPSLMWGFVVHLQEW